MVSSMFLTVFCHIKLHSHGKFHVSNSVLSYKTTPVMVSSMFLTVFCHIKLHSPGKFYVSNSILSYKTTQSW